MRVLSDNHMHTEYSSDGRGHAVGSIRDIVESARNVGLREIIISDHGPGHSLYGIKRKKLKEIRNEIDILNEEYDDINILMGMESNVMSYRGIIDLDFDEIQMLDRLSVGFHYGIIPKDLRTFFIFLVLNPISKVFKPLKKYVIKESTDALIKIVEDYPIDIITHPGSKVELDIERLSRVCELHGTALEINSHHSRLDIDSIKLAMKSEVKFSFGSDAHRPGRVGDLDNAVKRAIECKLPKDRIINIIDTKEKEH
ncbi:MAG: PHP domain-containing protein [Tissierellia bacterium]|nr:PHP domain-containing protein [Tissierellia bacterium]